MAEVGRPTEKTDDIIRKIEEVAALDGTVEEMAFYSGVHRATIYRWLKEDPELNDRINDLKQKPFLKARQTIVKNLENPQYAFEYMRRKKKEEFSDRSEVTGPNGKDLPAIQITGTIIKTDDSRVQNENPAADSSSAVLE